MSRPEVIVVGAGPGGCSAAFFLKHLSRGAEDVLLLDRLDEHKYHTYHRMCGEGISARAFRDLAPLAPEPHTNRIMRVVEHWPGVPPLETPADGFILDRPAFLRGIIDSFLKQDGQAREEAAAKIARKDGEYIVQCASGASYACKYLVGADGANSVVRRSLFGGEPGQAIWADQYIVDQTPEEEAMVFRYDERYHGGYRWEFPAGPRTRIGFPRGTDEAPKDPLETHRRAIPIGPVGRIVEGNACLIGDAAGQINPLTFGGIRTAMTAGKLAARAILAGDLASYERAWNRSKLASPSFMRAYDLLAPMSNLQMADSMSLFTSGLTPVNYVRSYLRKPRYRALYKAYRLSENHGW